MARKKSVPVGVAKLQRKRQQREIKLDRKIKALQNCDIPMIPKLPFSRLVREILQENKDNYRLTAVALAALQEACEYYLTLLTYHRRRVTLDRQDIRMVMHIREVARR